MTRSVLSLFVCALTLAFGLASALAREMQRSRKRRRNLKQLHRDLVALGFDGSYDRVAAFARDWRQRERERAHLASRGAYVPLAFAPGMPPFFGHLAC